MFVECERNEIIIGIVRKSGDCECNEGNAVLVEMFVECEWNDLGIGLERMSVDCEWNELKDARALLYGHTGMLLEIKTISYWNLILYELIDN